MNSIDAYCHSIGYSKFFLMGQRYMYFLYMQISHYLFIDIAFQFYIGFTFITKILPFTSFAMFVWVNTNSFSPRAFTMAYFAAQREAT
jgi:hypothetical protein